LFGCKVEIINDKNSDKNWFDVVEIDEAQEI
jgi:hypothetical protein